MDNKIMEVVQEWFYSDIGEGKGWFTAGERAQRLMDHLSVNDLIIVPKGSAYYPEKLTRTDLRK